MGYTHYWNIDLTEVTPEQTTALGLAAMKIIFIAKMMGIHVVRESDRADDPPEVGSGIIVFNGVGEDGHDTFWFDVSPNIPPCVPRPTEQAGPGHPGAQIDGWWEWYQYDEVVSSEGWRHSFCKTARKPYDAVVCAILIRAKELLGSSIDIGSDGDFDDASDTYGTWAAGRALYSSVYGKAPSSPLTRDVVPIV